MPSQSNFFNAAASLSDLISTAWKIIVNQNADIYEYLYGTTMVSLYEINISLKYGYRK